MFCSKKNRKIKFDVFNRLFIFIIVIFIIVGFGCRHSIAQTLPVPRAGDLDLTFGTGGKAMFSLLPNATGNGGRKAIIDSTGRIYQFGVTGSSPNEELASVIRLSANGSLDPTFDGDGIVVCYFPNFDSSLFYNGTLQPDGKLLAVGSANVNSVTYSLIARFLPNGQLDLSFNNIGYALFRNQSPITVDSYWSNVAVQSNGKIVVGGAISYQMGAARFNSDGSLDTTFGTDGYCVIQVSVLGELYDMKLSPDGAIVLGGRAMTNFNNANFSDFVILRLTPDGLLDPTFADNGVQRFDLTPTTGSDAEVINGIQILPDGKILAVGRTGDVFTNPIDAAIVRFQPDGQFDSAFGTDGSGYLIVDYNGENNLPQDLAIQADGKIVIAEFKGLYGNFLVQRLLPDGQFDSSFGIGGSVETDLGGKDYPFSVSLTSDKILLAGYCGRTTGSIQKVCLTQYLQNGQTATTAALKGRAVNLLGRGIAGAQIQIRNAATNANQIVTTDRTGNFQLPGALLNQEYLITPQANRCRFQNAPLTLSFSNPDQNVLLRANCFYPIK